MGDFIDDDGIAHTTATALSPTDMGRVKWEQGWAFYEACRTGDVVEATRMLGCYDAASLVKWRDVFSVRSVLREDEACGSPCM